jgi:hypothetical protein
MTIQDRIAGRKDTEEFISLASDGNDDYRVGVANAMRAHADEILGKVETGLRVMTDEEAVAFEKQRIEFGKHRGDKFVNVPVSYLSFVADSAMAIAAYLRSDRAAKRSREESGDA